MEKEHQPDLHWKIVKSTETLGSLSVTQILEKTNGRCQREINGKRLLQ